MLQLTLDDITTGWVKKSELDAYIQKAYQHGYFVSISNVNGNYSLSLKKSTEQSDEVKHLHRHILSQFQAFNDHFFTPFGRMHSIFTDQDHHLASKVQQLEQKIEQLESKR